MIIICLFFVQATTGISPFQDNEILTSQRMNEIVTTINRLQAELNEAKQELAQSRIPKGLITMWSGTISKIPNGWLLCDGTNGTPNLTGKFIKAGIDVNSSGGSFGHQHGIGVYSNTSNAVGQAIDVNWGFWRTVEGSHGSNNIHGNNGYSNSMNRQMLTDSSTNEPPFYVLAFIMKE